VLGLLVALAGGSSGLPGAAAPAAARSVPSPRAAASAPAAPPVRTVRIASPGIDPNGPSGDPSFGGDGGELAFASQATNLGPDVGSRRISNVYTYNLFTQKTSLVSAGIGGPANAASSTPSLSANGIVVFASKATNLVAGTPKHTSDVFIRVGQGPTRLLSLGFGGVQPDAPSSQPVISANGRYVAFQSSADDLVAGDDNGASDIFVVDLLTGTVRRADVTSGGGQANGDAYNPSISADGSLVSFTSDATNLVHGDHNHVSDVFVHNMLTGATRRVSVSGRGKEQNAGVPAPFAQISDLSGDGRFVVFDSNAGNLVTGVHGAHTEVFRHDLLTGATTVLSRSTSGALADNDSFAPATSADGSVTAFESFADNLAKPWVPNENVFVRDASVETTSTVDLTASGAPRGPEVDAQLLQQAAVSPDGQFVAFVSGAGNLVSGDFNGLDDLFVRYIGP
jgi:Tol biopolymer transport system component